MGRTVPTFTNIIDHEVSSWAKYRRGLRKEDQQYFDDIFRCARIHLAENFYAMRTVPFESILMSVVIEQRKMIHQLQDRLDVLEQKVRTAEQVPQIATTFGTSGRDHEHR
jgi:uncharacterized coiled-coil protein SlyX